MTLNSTNTTITSGIVNDYDYIGAAVYIAVILIWYSTGLALMLFLQVRPRTFQSQFLFDSKTTDKSTLSATNPFANYHNIQADNTAKQILNELKDPERRQRLWKIYYSSKEEQNKPPHPQYYQTITTDNQTIGRINRKLANIHRMGTRDGDDFVPSTLAVPSNDTKSFTKRFTSSRRPNGASTTIQRPLYRVQSQPDTPSATSFMEVEPLTQVKQSKATSATGSRKRNIKFLNRFTVEEVPECAAVNHND